MVDYFTALGLISAFSVLIPGIVILARFGRVKVTPFKTLTILISLFAIVHGIYHLLQLTGNPALGNILDLVTVLILIAIGAYYNARVS